MPEERLQKVLAAAGVASRRASEELIVAGRVTVNGHVVTELGTKVDPAREQVAVDGKPIHQPKRHVYMKVHKPRGVLSDVGGDAAGRKNVADLLPPEMRRLFPVGRLDLNSEGLVLMTDDGELANRLTHPRYEHAKTYYVLVAERPTPSQLEQFRTGIELPEGKSAPAEVRVVQQLPEGIRLAPGPTSGVWLEVTMREGKKRQIRHMTAAIGHPTLRLVRWAIGPLTLDDLKAGETAFLQRSEVAALRNAAREGGRATARPPAKPSTQPRTTPRKRPPGGNQRDNQRDNQQGNQRDNPRGNPREGSQRAEGRGAKRSVRAPGKKPASS